MASLAVKGLMFINIFCRVLNYKVFLCVSKSTLAYLIQT